MSKFDKRLKQLESFGFKRYHIYIGNGKYSFRYTDLDSISNEEWCEFINELVLESTNNRQTDET